MPNNNHNTNHDGGDDEEKQKERNEKALCYHQRPSVVIRNSEPPILAEAYHAQQQQQRQNVEVPFPVVLQATSTEETASTTATTSSVIRPGAQRIRGILNFFNQSSSTNTIDEEGRFRSYSTSATRIPSVPSSRIQQPPIVEAYSVTDEDVLFDSNQHQRDVSCSIRCCSCSIECKNLPAKHLKCALLAVVILVALITIPTSIILLSTLRPSPMTPPTMYKQCGENLTVTVDGKKNVFLGKPQNYTTPLKNDGKAQVCGYEGMGTELRLVSNISVAYAFPYKVVANQTIMEYDYFSPSNNKTLGTVICFDIDTNMDSERCFSATNGEFILLPSSSDTVNIGGENETSASTRSIVSSLNKDGTTHYKVPVGKLFVGVVNYLAFVSASKPNATNSTVILSNIKIKS